MTTRTLYLKTTGVELWLLSALQAFDEKTPSLGDICPMERANQSSLAYKAIGPLPPGGGANLRTCHTLGGGV